MHNGGKDQRALIGKGREKNRSALLTLLHVLSKAVTFLEDLFQPLAQTVAVNTSKGFQEGNKKKSLVKSICRLHKINFHEKFINGERGKSE